MHHVDPSESTNDQLITSAEPSVSARMDRLPVLRSHRLITVIVGLGVFFDQFENFLAATISKVLQNEFDLTGTTLSLVLASAFLGQFLGAILMGRLADRVGRRAAFVVNLLLYSVFSLIAAFAPDAAWLIVCRFIAGVGIGGEYALADSYLSDLLPKAVRGRYIAWAYTVSFLGIPFVGLLAHWLVPLAPLGVAGWRWLFVIGSVGGFLVWFIRRHVPESPRWLETQGRIEEARSVVETFEREAEQAGKSLPEPDPAIRPAQESKVPFGEIFRTPFRKRTLMLSVMNILQVFGYYGFGTVAVLVLSAKGFDVVESIGYTALTYFGYPIGSLLVVPFIEKFERKYLVMFTAGLMGVFGLAFGLGENPVWVVVAGMLFTMASNMFSNSYHVFMAENFPTRVRGTASGFAYSLSKLTSAFLPFILLPLLSGAGPVLVFSVVALAMALLILDVGVFGDRTTGRSADRQA